MRITRPALFTSCIVLLTIFPVIAHAQRATKMIAIALSLDGTKLAIVGNNSYQAIWDLTTNKQVVTFNVPSKRVDTIAWNPDGTRVASANSLDGIIRIWDVENGKLLTQLDSDIYSDGYAFVAWSPDGTKLATGIFSESAPIKIWNTKNDSYTLLANTDSQAFHGVAWSPNSKKLAVAGYYSASIIDDITSPVLRPVGPTKMIFAVAWSPDGNKVALGGAETLAVVNSTDGKVVFSSMEPKSAIDVVQWSPDGSYLATSNHASTIKIWDGTTFKLAKQLQREQGLVISGTSMSWSRYGGQLMFLGNISGEPTARSAANSLLKIAVPVASASRLSEIVERCANPTTQQQLTARLTAKQYSNFANDVKAMSKDQVPSACAADLIAVVNALQAAP